jgi:hypothetical protein
MTYRLANFASKAGNIVGDEVGQISILASVPNLLCRIEIRGIRRQPLDFDASGKETTESSGPRPMDGPAIHDKNKAMR